MHLQIIHLISIHLYQYIILLQKHILQLLHILLNFLLIVRFINLIINLLLNHLNY